jgi:hypothetical protein
MADEANRPIQSSRAPNAMFDVYQAPNIMDLYADGIGQVYSGPAVTKMEFFRITGFEGEGNNRVEKRELFMRLVMPSAPLIEATGNILVSSVSSIAQFDQAAKMIHDLIVSAAKKVQDVKL